MAWLYLFIAGGLEVFWSTFLTLSEGFTKLWQSVWAVVGMIASFFFLSQATKTQMCIRDRFLTLLVGMLTGVGGGVLRDLCCMERPYIFTKHIYACASLAGAAACMRCV